MPGFSENNKYNFVLFKTHTYHTTSKDLEFSAL